MARETSKAVLACILMLLLAAVAYQPFPEVVTEVSELKGKK
jgi:hypothetical protein